MHIVSQTSINGSVLRLPPLSAAAKYRPFAAKVLAWAGVAATASSRDRAKAIVGWVAAHAVHPATMLHPNDFAVNTSILPVGQTWATFNAEFDKAASINRDNAFWFALFPNGAAMLETLIGTVAIDGTVADNGMLTEYEVNAWRIRNFADFRTPQCTLQCKMSQVLLAAIGIPATDVSTSGHDPMAFYESETGQWLYIDPTFGEVLRFGDKYLTPLDLVLLSNEGKAPQVQSERILQFAYPLVSYFEGERLPAGMSFMSVYANPQWSGGISSRTPYRFPGVPSQSASNDIEAPASQVMPQLGCGFTTFKRVGQRYEFGLRSNWPDHVRFERSDDNGASWSECKPIGYLGDGEGTVIFRSFTADGFAGKPAVVAA